MKKIILSIITFAGLISISNAQRVQGTIRNANSASGNEVIVSIKPSAAFTAQMSNLIVSVQIPTSVGTRPMVAFTNLQANLFATWVQLDADQGDAFYTWGFNCATPGGSNTNATTWAAAELDVLKITFIGKTVPPFTVRLDHYLDGGTGANAIFYVETSLAAVNNGVLSDWGNLFYGAGASNGAAAAGNIGVSNAQYSFTTVPNIILPVKFLGFTALKKGDNAVLNWQIENENTNTDRYEVERSLNGVDFKKVNTVSPKKNGLSSNSYDLTDLNLSALRSAGAFYYRIKQFDKDGRFVYSETRSVRLTSNGIVIGIYPNPLKDIANLTVDLEQDANATVTINDVNGKKVKQIQLQLLKGFNNKKINIAALAAGSYLVKVQTKTEIKTISIVKTN